MRCRSWHARLWFCRCCFDVLILDCNRRVLREHMIARKCGVEKTRRLRAFCAALWRQRARGDSLLVACHGAAEERLQLAPAERFNLVTKIHSWNCDLPITHFFCLEFDIEYLCAIVTLTDQTFSFLSFFGFARPRRKQQQLNESPSGE